MIHIYYNGVDHYDAITKVTELLGASYYCEYCGSFMFLFCLVFAMSLCASVYMCFVVTCWKRADLLALVCGVYCEFVLFPLVSWVRCGT